jgi:hypothetical protein
LVGGVLLGVLWRECGGLGWVEQGYGFLAEVAALADLPLVVGLDEHRAGQAQQDFVVGEDPDDVFGERGDLSPGVARHGRDGGELSLGYDGDGVDLLADQWAGVPGGLGEDGANRGGDQLGLAIEDLD